MLPNTTTGSAVVGPAFAGNCRDRPRFPSDERRGTGHSLPGLHELRRDAGRQDSVATTRRLGETMEELRLDLQITRDPRRGSGQRQRKGEAGLLQILRQIFQALVR